MNPFYLARPKCNQSGFRETAEARERRLEREAADAEQVPAPFGALPLLAFFMAIMILALVGMAGRGKWEWLARMMF